jgi:hypothetical protein
VWETILLCGDVPRSPWPVKGIVQDLERLYVLRRIQSSFK